jgi:allantoate deiminase
MDGLTFRALSAMRPERTRLRRAAARCGIIAAMSDARTVLERCDALAGCSEEEGRLTRRFATPALAGARALVEGWMGEAGLTTRHDPLGNLFGRIAGEGERTLLLGSHLDTVRDAGRYDGALGILVALACAERLRGAGLPFALEVAAFADEEGVRYGTGYLGSSVPAGRFDPAWLERRDEDGVTLADAVRGWGGDPEALASAGLEGLLAYAEVHIEQGPVLDDAALPVGVVTGIAGQTRAWVAFEGTAGHAGTTPMDVRRDALAGAAEWIAAVELEALGRDGLVATVGRLAAEPGAPNVIPGQAVASLDLRHADDEVRDDAAAALRGHAERIAERRRLGVAWDQLQSTPAVPCSPRLTEELAAAARDTGLAAPRLASGAGHDAAMLAAAAPVAMLFVRCAGGVSHHPGESVREEDVAVAVDVTARFVERLAARAD